MNNQHRVHDLIDKLVVDGATLITQTPNGDFVKAQAYSAWRARCKLLASLLGPTGQVWASDLALGLHPDPHEIVRTNGLLKGIKQSAEEGLLLRIEDLVLADAFSNLLEQAEYLLGQGYFLAAGVILRAVLEERLRGLCDRHGLTLARPKPTLNDYNQELYKATVYDKLTFKELDALVAIGNDAAHNAPTLTREHVDRLLDGATRFLTKFAS